MRILCFLIVLLAALPDRAAAQTINTIQHINFGEAIVADNSSQYSITVNSNGSYSADSIFTFISTPTRGVYHATGLPPNTSIISITVSVDQQLIGTGEDFIVDNFDIDAPSSTDASGELDINLGARLRTSGTGTNYTSATNYASSMTLTINY